MIYQCLTLSGRKQRITVILWKSDNLSLHGIGKICLCGSLLSKKGLHSDTFFVKSSLLKYKDNNSNNRLLLRYQG